MKKLIISLLSGMVKDLLLKFGNRLLDEFILYLKRKTVKKFGNRAAYYDIMNMLNELDIEDFLKSPEVEQATKNTIENV